MPAIPDALQLLLVVLDLRAEQIRPVAVLLLDRQRNPVGPLQLRELTDGRSGPRVGFVAESSRQDETVRDDWRLRLHVFAEVLAGALVGGLAFDAEVALPALAGIEALNDQQTAGILMKIGNLPVIWATMAVIWFRWYKGDVSQKGRTILRDPVTGAPLRRPQPTTASR